jgi:REP element-mobilizing transposase RayT
MANSYKKIYIHLVFAVKNREALLEKQWRPKVFSYLPGIIKNRGHFPLAVNGYFDHVHILFDYNPQELIPKLVREVKKSSSAYIKNNGLSKFKFEWQGGYGAFSVGWKEKERMIEYIRAQEEHHKRAPFNEEYVQLLNEFEVSFKDEYVFNFF